MTTDTCDHTWGEAEECETGRGLVRSPICTQCGALKHEVDLRARRLLEQNRAEFKPSFAPVHTHQAQFFHDV
jgi:hypothetical protein